MYTSSDVKYNIGYVSCYISDHPFVHVCQIPELAAIEWVKKTCPETIMGNDTAAKYLIAGDDHKLGAKGGGWLNKLFVIVGLEHGKWIALFNHDGRFSVYVEK